MAAASPMTWNWNWKLVVTGAAALTGVLGLGSPLQLAGPAAHPQLSDRPHAAAQVTAVAELEEQTHAVLHGMEPGEPQVYPHPIAFNVLGGAGNFADGDDHTDEERKMMFETRKILGDESIAINVTCARVPVRNCHSESVTLQTREPLSVEDARALLEGMDGLTMVDDPASHGYPTALTSAGRDDVFVGRLRRDPSHERGLCLWVVSDNLLKGAATNAVQIAEVLHERGLIQVPAAA